MERIRALAWCLAVATAVLSASGAAAQAPPPPKPRTGGEAPPAQQAPEARPDRFVQPVAPPPAPVLVVTADMDCTLELDGEVLGTLQKDVVQEFRVRAGDHLLQAFPAGIEGPTWKETLKAPDTGRVVAVVELADVVEEWNESQANANEGRFTVGDSSIADTDTGMVWTKNVSPAMRWQDVAGYFERQRTDGASNWRLPTIDELSKLYDPDHPAPRQETTRPETQFTLFGKRRGDIQVQPRLIFEPFDHNSVSALWVRGADERVLCAFLGEFTCAVGGKKEMASLFCVRPAS
jgi:hypothetical protein